MQGVITRIAPAQEENDPTHFSLAYSPFIRLNWVLGATRWREWCVQREE
jgi:hypothetical protein